MCAAMVFWLMSPRGERRWSDLVFTLFAGTGNIPAWNGNTCRQQVNHDLSAKTSCFLFTFFFFLFWYTFISFHLSLRTGGCEVKSWGSNRQTADRIVIWASDKKWVLLRFVSFIFLYGCLLWQALFCKDVSNGICTSPPPFLSCSGNCYSFARIALQFKMWKTALLLLELCQA